MSEVKKVEEKKLHKQIQNDLNDLRFTINNSRIVLNDSPAVLRRFEKLQKTLDSFAHDN